MAYIGLFRPEDTKLDFGLKITTLINLFCLFINSFFGYWISLDKKEFGKDVSSWSSFSCAVIFFYIGVELVSSVTYLAVIYQWPRILFGLDIPPPHPLHWYILPLTGRSHRHLV